MAAAAAALVTVVFWASAFVGIRSAGRVFSPGALSLGRLGGAEGRPAPADRAADDPALLRDRRRLLPPVRASARTPGRRCARRLARLDRLPRRLPDRRRVRDLGFRPLADGRRPARRDDVPRAAALDPVRLALARC